MQIADRRGIDEEEVLRWPKDKFDLWVAFYQEEADRAAKAAKRR